MRPIYSKEGATQRAGVRESQRKVYGAGTAGMRAPTSSSQARLITGTGQLVDPPDAFLLSVSAFHISVFLWCLPAEWSTASQSTVATG